MSDVGAVAHPEKQMIANLLKRSCIKSGSLNEKVFLEQPSKEVNRMTIKKLERPIAPAVSIVKGN
jgi:hypothetical protein